MKYICVECSREGATKESDLCHSCEVKQAEQDRAEAEALAAEEADWYDYDDIDWLVDA